MIYLLDASALINNLNFEFQKENTYITTPQILNELKSIETKHLAENAMHHGLLKTQQERQQYVEVISSILKKNNFSKLSLQDKSILALALEFKESGEKFEVLTDDYSIQNFLSILEIPFSSLIQGEIKQTLSFKKYCSACGKKFSSEYSKTICDFCGSAIKKKPVFSKKKQ